MIKANQRTILVLFFYPKKGDINKKRESKNFIIINFNNGTNFKLGNFYSDIFYKAQFYQKNWKTVVLKEGMFSILF